MTLLIQRFKSYFYSAFICLSLIACAGDALQSGLDPFAPMIFKEGSTAMPLNPPNKGTLQPFYVSRATIFKLAVDTKSILIGADGVTRYIVVMTNPSGETQTQYEGIRCDSFQWRLYGNFENGVWKENPLAAWREISSHIPNRYQAALAQGAFCNMTIQEKNIQKILSNLNSNTFTGSIAPPPL